MKAGRSLANTFGRFILIALIMNLVMGPLMSPIAEAATSDWQQKGVSINPQSPDDFGSATFDQSVQNAKNDGANYVTLIVPIYQSNLNSTDIGPGWNTPSNASLISAIQYIHSLGMHVMLKPHLESYTGDWRAMINPSDRQGWFAAYGNMLTSYAKLAQQYGVEDICIGTELISMSTYTSNQDNTQQWETMISNVRSVYSGKLTYSANWGGSDFANEKSHIGFWSDLDYIGISAYFPLSSAPSDSVSDLSNAWDSWNNSDIKPLEQQWGKPVVFTEIGYRSVNGARNDPFDSGRSGSYDPQEQSNDYQALFSYWGNYSYMQGIELWNWQSDPNGGGSGNTDYTPQNKPAEGILKQWYMGTATQPPPPGNPAFNASAQTNSTPTVNQSTSLNVTVTNTSSNGSSGDVVDVEIYDASNQQVLQKFFDSQTFAANQSQTYQVNWTPSVTGSYTLKVGVFNGNWSVNYYWGNSVLALNVGQGSTNPPPPPNTTLDVWWPSDGSKVSGVQPFKAMVENMNISDYQMYWQVDGDRLNQMSDSDTDYPHKESLVDLTNWNWKGAGPYTVNFVAKDGGGNVISQKAVNIYTQ